MAISTFKVLGLTKIFIDKCCKNIRIISRLNLYLGKYKTFKVILCVLDDEVRGMKNNTKGSITVFLSGILLLIIVFTCTTIESARYKVAGIQAERALMSAANSLIASYDSQLANEYGLFAYEKPSVHQVRKELGYYTSQSLETDDIISSCIAGSGSEHPNTWDIYDYQIASIDFIPVGYLVEKTPDYLEVQILDYMKYRAPLLLIEPFLEKLELIKKSSLTTQYINQKMDITKKAGNIEGLYSELIRTVEGIRLGHQKTPTASDIFVKGLLTNPNSDVQSYIQDIPDTALQQQLKNKYLNINHIASHFKDIINRTVDTGNDVIVSYKETYLIREKVKSLNKAYRQSKKQLVKLQLKLTQSYLSQQQIQPLQKDINKTKKELSSLKKELKQKEEQLANHEKDLKRSISKFNQYYNEKELIISQLQSIYSSDQSQHDGYLKCNQKALTVIRNIESESKSLVSHIDNYRETLKANKSEIIESAYTALNHELEELKADLSSDSQYHKFSLTDNLPWIKKVIAKNISTIEKSKPTYENLVEDNEKLMVHLLANHFDPFDQEDRNLLDQFIQEHVFPIPKDWLNQIVSCKRKDHIFQLEYHVDSILKQLAHYSSSIYFEYGDKLSSEEISSLDPRDDIKSFTIQQSAQEKHLMNTSKPFDNQHLPSYLLHNGLVTHDLMSDAVSFDDESLAYTTNTLDVLSNFNCAGLKLIDLRDELYINEYIMGHFNCASDHNQGIYPISLSRYSQNAHALDYEIEYAIVGANNEQTNLQSCKNQILGIRFAMNLIHILTNTEKRTVVWSIASAIAGWWTLGIGAYVIAALIMSAWSYAESHLDIQKLLKGEAVAFYKMPNDWVLDYKNIPQFIIDAGSQNVVNKLDTLVDQYSNDIKKTVSRIRSSISDTSTDYIDQKLNGILDIGVSLQENANCIIDSTIEQVIDDSFHAILESKPYPSADIYMNLQYQGGEIVSEILDKIHHPSFKEVLKTCGYKTVVKQKENLIHEYQHKINHAKQKITKQTETMIQDTLNQFESGIQDHIDASSHKIKSLAKDKINHLSNQLKDTCKKKLSTVLDKNIGTTGKSKVMNLIPKLTYRDYLRLLLLLNHKESKLYRVMDLLQLNMSKFRQDPTLQLSHYIYSFNIKSNLIVNPLFFKLPFMPKKAKDFKGYSLEIETSATY